MKRRNFLIFGTFLGLSTSTSLDAKIKSTKQRHFEKTFKKLEPTLRAVQEHLFPQGSKIPSAKSMNLTKFLFETMKHSSFDRDIKAFVLEGARELEKREKNNFTKLSVDAKEKALREFEETNYGSNWLGRMMTLSMEGLFSDPIYGANKKEAGWKSIAAYGAFPRAKEKYLGV